jgi:glutathione synthase
MKHLFLMDPLHTVHPAKDTTFALMVGAQRGGHETFFVPSGGISLRHGELFLHAAQVIPSPDQVPPFVQESSVVLSQAEVDVVWIRTDPPFNEQYLRHTWLLDHLPDTVPVINTPAGIRAVNEKLWATQFTSITPKTLVTSYIDHAREFLEHEGEVVVKPTDGYGGHGVFYLKRNDPNLHVTLETLSCGGRRELIVQQYVPAASHGDKRILLLNGEPLGAVMRVHSESDHRNNLFAGGRAEPASVTAQDRKIIDVLKPHLQRLGLYFVGIDVIGLYLIEVNVTSPTCLQEMSRFANQPLEDQVIRFAESLAVRRKT